MAAAPVGVAEAWGGSEWSSGWGGQLRISGSVRAGMAAALKQHKCAGDGEEAQAGIEQGDRVGGCCAFQGAQGGQAFEVDDRHRQNQKAGKSAFAIVNQFIDEAK